MSSHLVYLIIGIVCLIAGVWRLARRGNAIAFIVGLLWLVAVLFQFYVPGAYNFKPLDRIPSAGNLVHYVALPVFTIILLFSVREKS
jgi:hypothetical protein